jgi:hypothetical protein
MVEVSTPLMGNNGTYAITILHKMVNLLGSNSVNGYRKNKLCARRNMFLAS